MESLSSEMRGLSVESLTFATLRSAAAADVLCCVAGVVALPPLLALEVCVVRYGEATVKAEEAVKEEEEDMEVEVLRRSVVAGSGSSDIGLCSLPSFVSWHSVIAAVEGAEDADVVEVKEEVDEDVREAPAPSRAAR